MNETKIPVSFIPHASVEFLGTELPMAGQTETRDSIPALGTIKDVGKTSKDKIIIMWTITPKTVKTVTNFNVER